MQIAFVEIQNFRKLKSVRIDLSEKTTLLVGANNSGKTSAMLALGHFLIASRRRFATNDFTLSNWRTINSIGSAWSEDQIEEPLTTLAPWETVLPSLDLWLDVEGTQIHYVRALLPSLSWAGGRLGVRLRLEPRSISELQRAFLTTLRDADKVRKAAGSSNTLTVWPTDLKSFLDRKLHEHFIVRFYSLDPTKCEDPTNGIAKVQSLATENEAIDGDPLDGLIRVDEVSAQRGFTDASGGKVEMDESRDRRRLSEQLRAYYAKHLDASDLPDPADYDALQAIESAQGLFNERLTTGFAAALSELSTLNYPGITDARLKVLAKVRPADGLNHSAAVQYEVLPDAEAIGANLRLPEDYNGLGYQNLISMVFRLMGFRDGWMRVGKASKDTSTKATNQLLPPLHLVLVEEPEAHLHVQVQQVFLRKAYDVLRNHPQLQADASLRTQMVVSTHSSHVAHEMEFASVRYFRRLPRAGVGSVPVSGVINLSEVFGPNDDTARFVARYLRATHCDLFFADAAILVEGPAERILIPHFIRRDYARLHFSYVSLLEIGGSHAHRLRGLIEHLGLTTLVVTDIDSCAPDGKRKSVVPCRNAGLKSRNATLALWHPEKDVLDELWNVVDADKVKKSDDGNWCVRVAYQMPVSVAMVSGGDTSEAPCTTFEDSLIFENLELFRSLEGSGLIETTRDGLLEQKDAATFGALLWEALKRADKAKFALDLLWYDKLTSELKPPQYIKDGLAWLQEQICRNEAALVALPAVAAKDGAVATPSQPTKGDSVPSQQSTPETSL
jgi:predicted ATP-dependent endonuclease of OLD family